MSYRFTVESVAFVLRLKEVGVSPSMRYVPVVAPLGELYGMAPYHSTDIPEEVEVTMRPK